MDVFRLGAAGGPWHAADLDSDGDLDLTIWIDDRGELVHFLRDPESEGFVHMEAGNTLVDPAGWRRMETSVGASVEALTSVDLNQDGWTDLVISCPGADRLEVFWGSENEESRFKRSDRVRMEDLARGSQTLGTESGITTEGAATALKVLTEDGVRTLRWKKGTTTLAENSLTHGSAGGARFLVPVDVNGDQALDMISVSTASADRPYPVRTRLRVPGATEEWSPEQLLRVESGRYLGHTITGEEPIFFFGERDRPVLTGYRVVPVSTSQDQLGVRVIPLSAEGLGKSRMAQGDIDADGDIDVVVLDAKGSRLIPIFNEDGDLFPGKSSPTLQKPEDLLVSEGKVYVFSKSEGGIGVSKLDGRGLSFPDLQPMKRSVDSLVAVGGFTPSGDLLTMHKGSGRSDYDLVYGEQQFPIGKVNREPSAVRLFPGAEGSTLIVVEIPFESPKLFSLNSKAASGEEEVSETWIDEIEAPATIESGGKITSLAPGKILVTQKNRARIVEITAGKARVIRQLDVPGTGAEVTASAAIQWNADDDSDRSEIVLIDQGNSMIHLGNEKEVISSQEGPFKKILQAAGYDLGNGTEELLLLNDRALMVVARPEGSLEMIESFSRRANHENSRITAIASGDLNGDGLIDLAAVDGARGELEILAGSAKGFVPALGFPVFERKTFSGGGRGVEPRAILVEDFDGDGLDDVVLMIHDRWIMYPQQNLDNARDSR
ncbi:MAG: hypothetical protein CBC13_01085 [Planctomycetia bacterium TMED53]|nr:MAG: hypothetical protein CBC13_01085 [Planctomycetia bacterium TMED53]